MSVLRRVGSALLLSLGVLFLADSASWATSTPEPTPTETVEPTPTEPVDPTPTEPVDPTPTPEPTPAETGPSEVVLSNDQFMPLLLAAGFTSAGVMTLVVLTFGAHGD